MERLLDLGRGSPKKRTEGTLCRDTRRDAMDAPEVRTKKNYMCTRVYSVYVAYLALHISVQVELNIQK